MVEQSTITSVLGVLIVIGLITLIIIESSKPKVKPVPIVVRKPTVVVRPRPPYPRPYPPRPYF